MDMDGTMVSRFARAFAEPPRHRTERSWRAVGRAWKSRSLEIYAGARTNSSPRFPTCHKLCAYVPTHSFGVTAEGLERVDNKPTDTESAKTMQNEQLDLFRSFARSGTVPA